ncbi:Arginine/serine-rich coiled-coil protein 2 [Fasciola gigantica]|uniref:Arginine/serine-rich coiled-coil protein 2 n=1 Tax=Fasciola gigantica TaxID=46835 RepID=A0A504YWP4_FASGI|nr:Arginine/serine-rich coiled-coil protein 2 [Fasciola gigantica]
MVTHPTYVLIMSVGPPVQITVDDQTGIEIVIAGFSQFRSSLERHRHSHKGSRSRRSTSRSHSKKRSKRRSAKRQGHRRSHHDRRHRDGDSRRHRSRSRRHHRKHRHRISSSSSSDDESHKQYAPTVVRSNLTGPKAVSSLPCFTNDKLNPFQRSPSHDLKNTADKNQNIKATVTAATTVASGSTLTSPVTSTAAPTSITPTTVSSLRLNTRDLLDQIQKHQEAQAKAQAIAAAAAVNLPKYYNPSSVNAIKLAEQQQKRKLLWSKKPDNSTDSDGKTALWASTSLIAGKGDQAAAAKFRKLMGIHENMEQSQSSNPSERDTQMRAEAQAELFRRLEQEYEVSRALTHTQRGVGLGFSSAAHVDYNAYAAMQSDAQKGDH